MTQTNDDDGTAKPHKLLMTEELLGCQTTMRTLLRNYKLLMIEELLG